MRILQGVSNILQRGGIQLATMGIIPPHEPPVFPDLPPPANLPTGPPPGLAGGEGDTGMDTGDKNGEEEDAKDKRIRDDDATVQDSKKHKKFGDKSDAEKNDGD
jgi:hypothetical protein